MQSTVIASPLGPVLITSSGKAITSVFFLDEEAGLTETPNDPLILECIRQLEAYFSGRIKQFEINLQLTVFIFVA